MASLSSYYPQPVIAGTTAGTYAEGNDSRIEGATQEAPEDGVIYGRKDADWVDITEPANLQIRRGTATEVAAITPLEGEPVWATDTKLLVLGDGSTQGGVQVGNFPIAGVRPTAAGLFTIGKLQLANSMTIVGANTVLGNSRGIGSVDLQLGRTAATQVASGLRSAILSGISNTATGTSCVVLSGTTNTASGTRSAVIGGDQSSVNATSSIVHGDSCSVTGNYSLALGYKANADRRNMFCLGAGSLHQFDAIAQSVVWVLKCRTVNSTPKTMSLSSGTDSFNNEDSIIFPTIPENRALFGTVQIAAIEPSTATESAHYVRKFGIQNLGGTTSLIGSVTTVGTDHESDAGYDVAITADDTGDYLKIDVTGDASKTLRWVAVIHGVEAAI
jgi:hypothetical protein